MNKPVEIRCPLCNRFHAEFPQGIPADTNMRFAPHKNCALVLVIEQGELCALRPSENRHVAFDRRQRVA